MLARRCARLGLDVIDPKPGEPVVAGLHLIEEYAPGEPGIIQECLEWGFRTGSRVIRPAKVAAGKPEN
jgi:molecular chaperone GrpE (heat shock protein)